MSERRSSRTATAAVIIAGVLWGFLGTFNKILTGYGLGSLQIQSIRVVFSALIFLLILAIYRPALLKIRIRDLWMFVGTGVISTFFFGVCYFYTGIHSETSIAVVLLYTSPVFVMLMSALFFKEQITRRKVAALLMTFIGCVLVAGLSGGSANLTPFTLMTGLASGFFYALYSIFGKYALEKYETLTVTAYTFFCAAVVSLPLAGIGQILDIYKTHPAAIGWSFCVSFMSTVLTYFLYSWGLKRMESGKAAVLVTTEPLVGAVLGIALFHESHGILKILGMALILGAIVVLSGQEKKEKK